MPRLAKDWPGLSINGKRKVGPCRSCGELLHPIHTKYYDSHKVGDDGLCPVRRKREEQGEMPEPIRNEELFHNSRVHG
jgi:hypothetical protein